MFNRNSVSYIYFLVFFDALLPFFFIFFFYSSIFLKIQSLQAHSQIANLEDQMKKIKGLLASSILFLLCYGPFTIVILTDFDSAYPKDLSMYTMALLHANSSFNAVLYYFTNTPIRKGYKNFFNLIFRRNLYKYK